MPFVKILVKSCWSWASIAANTTLVQQEQYLGYLPSAETKWRCLSPWELKQTKKEKRTVHHWISLVDNAIFTWLKTKQFSFVCLFSCGNKSYKIGPSSSILACQCYPAIYRVNDWLWIASVPLEMELAFSGVANGSFHGFLFKVLIKTS